MSMPDPELEAWRDECRAALEVLGLAATLFNLVFGVNRYGFHGLRPALEKVSAEEHITISLLLLVVARANPELRQGMEAFRQLTDGWAAQMRYTLTLHEAIRVEVPGLAAKLMPGLPARIRHFARTGQVPEVVHEMAQEHQAEIDAMFERHPELRSPSGNGEEDTAPK
jgi:hypothetical protein